MNKIVVVAAIVIENEKILCVQRGTHKFAYISKKFEFPGGKVEPGESYADALVRELDEELKLKVEVTSPFLTVDHKYPDFALEMHSFLCRSFNPQELQLSEHINFRWLSTAELGALDWAGADIPIVKLLEKKFNE